MNKSFSIEQEKTKAPYLSKISLTFALPKNFGDGWDYIRVHIFGSHHAWAGSYDKSNSENFAHEALHRMSGVTETSLYVGTSCSVSFDVSSVDEATEIQARLKALVDAFPSRGDRRISVRGSSYYDSVVVAFDSELDADVSMPFMKYLALHVPLAVESHPALYDINISVLNSQAEISTD